MAIPSVSYEIFCDKVVDSQNLGDLSKTLGISGKQHEISYRLSTLLSRFSEELGVDQQAPIILSRLEGFVTEARNTGLVYGDIRRKIEELRADLTKGSSPQGPCYSVREAQAIASLIASNKNMIDERVAELEKNSFEWKDVSWSLEGRIENLSLQINSMKCSGNKNRLMDSMKDLQGLRANSLDCDKNLRAELKIFQASLVELMANSEEQKSWAISMLVPNLNPKEILEDSIAERKEIGRRIQSNLQKLTETSGQSRMFRALFKDVLQTDRKHVKETYLKCKQVHADLVNLAMRIQAS